MVMMGTRKLWTCWQGTLRWNAELPLKYVGTGMYFPADRLCKAWLFCRFLQWGCEPRLTRDQESLTPPEKKREWQRAYCTWSSFSPTRPLQHFLPVAHFATRRMLPVCEQPSHPTWHCALTAMVPTSSHRVSAETLGLLDCWCLIIIITISDCSVTLWRTWWMPTSREMRLVIISFTSWRSFLVDDSSWLNSLSDSPGIISSHM